MKLNKDIFSLRTLIAVWKWLWYVSTLNSLYYILSRAGPKFAVSWSKSSTKFIEWFIAKPQGPDGCPKKHSDFSILNIGQKENCLDTEIEVLHQKVQSSSRVSTEGMWAPIPTYPWGLDFCSLYRHGRSAWRGKILFSIINFSNNLRCSFQRHASNRQNFVVYLQWNVFETLQWLPIWSKGVQKWQIPVLLEVSH